MIVIVLVFAVGSLLGGYVCRRFERKQALIRREYSLEFVAGQFSFPTSANQALHRLCYGQPLSPERAMRPKTDGILESSLYVSDVPRSVRFYQETFGFRVISDFGERGCAMQTHIRSYCCSRRELRARFNRLTAGTASYMSHSLSRPTNWPTENPGSKREESRWKKSGSGNWESGASTFETRTAI